jgi:hypothetical protein
MLCWHGLIDVEAASGEIQVEKTPVFAFTSIIDVVVAPSCYAIGNRRTLKKKWKSSGT